MNSTTLPRAGWGQSMLPPGGRRLPVFLLLDCSYSMQGPRIQSLHLGLEQFQRELSQNRDARDVVHVSVIAFNSAATLLTPRLVPARDFSAPRDLEPDGCTRLDLALQLLLETMDSELVPQAEGKSRGDWRPVVFILTDGEPTGPDGKPSDNWQAAMDALVNREQGRAKPSTVIAVGCGVNVSDDRVKMLISRPGIVLRETLSPKELATTRLVVGVHQRMGDSQAAFVALFRWLSRSLGKSVDTDGNPNNPFAGPDGLQYTQGAVP